MLVASDIMSVFMGNPVKKKRTICDKVMLWDFDHWYKRDEREIPLF